MNALYEAALEVQQFCKERSRKFCIIGGLALLRWGQPRQTSDVDASVLTNFEFEEEFVESFLERFKSRIEGAREFAIENRVILAHASNGVPLDISLAGFPFVKEMIGRASEFLYYKDTLLVTASAEDMVILKVFASRPRDWSDVEGIIVRQAEHLDWDLIRRELTPLCALKNSPESVDRLFRLRDQIQGDSPE